MNPAGLSPAEEMIGLLREIRSASMPRDYGILEHQRRNAALKENAVSRFLSLGGVFRRDRGDLVAVMSGISGKVPIRHHPRDAWLALAAWREMATPKFEVTPPPTPTEDK